MSDSPESRASQMRRLRDLVAHHIGEVGADELAGSLLRFASLVREWDARGNLVSSRDAERLLSRHIPESLEIAAAVRAFAPRSVLDLGSGAGLPGIPIALTTPASTVVLLESRRMKSIFLLRAIRELRLANCYAWCARAETIGTRVSKLSPPLEAGDPGAGEDGTATGAAGIEGALAGWSRLSVEPPSEIPPFDVLTARAVAPLVTLARLAEPLVRSGGRLVAAKGSRAEEEIREWKRSPGGWAMERVPPALAMPVGDPNGVRLVVLRRKPNHVSRETSPSK